MPRCKAVALPRPEKQQRELQVREGTTTTAIVSCVCLRLVPFVLAVKTAFRCSGAAQQYCCMAGEAVQPNDELSRPHPASARELARNAMALLWLASSWAT